MASGVGPAGFTSIAFAFFSTSFSSLPKSNSKSLVPQSCQHRQKAPTLISQDHDYDSRGPSKGAG